jgi:SHS family lactate transporter-like MFS transporter
MALRVFPRWLALYIRTKVPESAVWKEHRATSTTEIVQAIGSQWKRFAYLVALMTFMMSLSHGTQDPRHCLAQERRRVPPFFR